MCNYQKINRAETKNYWAKDWLTDKLTNWLTGKFGNCKALKLRRTGELWWTTVTICMCDNCCQTGNNDNGTNNNQPGTLNCHWHGGVSRRTPTRRPEFGDRRLEPRDTCSSHKSWKAKGELPRTVVKIRMQVEPIPEILTRSLQQKPSGSILGLTHCKISYKN